MLTDTVSENSWIIGINENGSFCGLIDKQMSFNNTTTW